MADSSSKKSTSKSTGKSKKSKAEQIRNTVGQYLKERQYVPSEKYRKSDLQLTQNKREFFLRTMIQNDLMKQNSFLYSNVLCLKTNHHIVDQQFNRFVQFVEALSDNARSEMRSFLGPLICHFYLELLKVKEPKVALDFLKKYAHLIGEVEDYELTLPVNANEAAGVEAEAEAAAPAESETAAAVATVVTQIKYFATENEDDESDAEREFFKRLIEAISSCSTLEAASEIEEVQIFRSSKYELYLTEASFTCLSEFLQTKGHVFLLNIVHNWIQVNIIDYQIPEFNEHDMFYGAEAEDEEMGSMDEEELNFTSSSGETLESQPHPAKEAEAEEEPAADLEGMQLKMHMCMKSVSACRALLLEHQKIYPRFIKVAERNHRLVTASLDASACHFAAGYDHSNIWVWQLNQQTYRGKNLYRSLTDSECPWEISNSFYDNKCDNEIDADILRVEKGENEQFERIKTCFDSKKYEENTINAYGGIRLLGHSAGITCLRFSLQYPLLYSVSKDKHFRCWRADNYTCAGLYIGHSYPIWCIDESPAGQYVATGSRDLTARLWCLEREHPLITYAGHTQDVESIAFHPNGNYLATGSADRTVRLWCVTTGKPLRIFIDCKQAVTSLVFSPNGKLLAAAGEEKKIRIFDLATGSQLVELKEQSTTVTSLSWSSSGRYLASGGIDGCLRIWDMLHFIESQEDDQTATTSATAAASAAAAAHPKQVLALTSNCKRLVNVSFNKQEIPSGIGC